MRWLTLSLLTLAACGGSSPATSGRLEMGGAAGTEDEGGAAAAAGMEDAGAAGATSDATYEVGHWSPDPPDAGREAAAIPGQIMVTFGNCLSTNDPVTIIADTGTVVSVPFGMCAVQCTNTGRHVAAPCGPAPGPGWCPQTSTSSTNCTCISAGTVGTISTAISCGSATSFEWHTDTESGTAPCADGVRVNLNCPVGAF